jgi:16S rRNA (guanine(527)-N(7))-methyltransferase RsmG
VLKTLKQALEEHQQTFEIALSADAIDRLANYYDVVMEHNELLHLVGPCSAEEFAVRHILESLALLKHLPPKTKFADIGPGAGLPSIPCLLVRDDLRALLIESKVKKSTFLNEAVEKLDLSDKAAVINSQFEETQPGDTTYVTCRALDKFVVKLPRLLRWSRQRKLLFFGGPALGEAMRKQDVRFKQELMPLSEQRFLFYT